jgi:ubiquinone/menaquinone biosynthesis C-methylase UbiE
MRFQTSWIFDLGADIYGWFTAQTAWRASCARLAEHLPAADRLRVADLGCGPGVSAIELARRRPGDLIIGLDIASRMLAVARRRLASARLPAGDVQWVRGDGAHLPFETGSLDALTGHSFLYLLPDREAALAESLRVLRPGGRLVLMEPNARPATAGQVLGVSRDPRHLVSVGLWRPFSRFHGRFTAASLAATLEGAGFANCQVEEVLGGLGLMAWAEKPQLRVVGRRS